jgi:hypothetical protein
MVFVPDLRGFKGRLVQCEFGPAALLFKRYGDDRFLTGYPGWIEPFPGEDQPFRWNDLAVNSPCLTWIVPPGARRAIRQEPPGRTSIWQDTISKPCGPHQMGARSGSVQARKTKALGAAKTRVRTRVGRSVGSMAGIVRPGLDLLQVSIQPVEALLPEMPVGFEPIRDVLQPVGPQAARTGLRGSSA